MVKTVSISELRKALPQLLKELQEHPDRVYQISVNQVIMGELVSPRRVQKRGQAAKRLLTLSERFEKRYQNRTEPANVSEEHDRIIYR